MKKKVTRTNKKPAKLATIICPLCNSSGLVSLAQAAEEMRIDEDDLMFALKYLGIVPVIDGEGTLRTGRFNLLKVTDALAEFGMTEMRIRASLLKTPESENV